MKRTNEYARNCMDLYAAPKAVFAAIAYSFCSSGGDLSVSEAQKRLLDEWWTLYENGIVPQKPPRARE